MRLHKEIKKALEETGKPWTTEQGRRHVKLRVDGKLVGIVSNGSAKESNSRDVKNTVAQIRRAA